MVNLSSFYQTYIRYAMIIACFFGKVFGVTGQAPCTLPQFTSV